MEKDCKDSLPKIIENKRVGKNIVVTFNKELDTSMKFGRWFNNSWEGWSNKFTVMKPIYEYNELKIEKIWILKTDKKKLVISLKEIPPDRYDLFVSMQGLLFII